jgi:phage tail sheath gpL-like
MAINGRAYSFTADGSATATEIVTGLKDLINADADNGVIATGTATLILTADVEGVPFSVSLGANLSAAATTANAVYTTLLSGAKFLTAASAGGLAKIELNLV